MTEPSSLPPWCPKECGWRHRAEVACPKKKLPMPQREPGMEDGQEYGPIVRSETSTLHDVQATCTSCGVVRTLSIFAPPEKLTMLRICDSCQGLKPRPAVPERPTSLPYPDD